MKEKAEPGAEKGGTSGEDWFVDYVTTEVEINARVHVHAYAPSQISRQPVKSRVVCQTPTAQYDSIIESAVRLRRLCALRRLSLSLTSGLFINNLVRSHCISSVFIKLVLFPLLLRAGLFTGPEIFSVFTVPAIANQ